MSASPRTARVRRKKVELLSPMIRSCNVHSSHGSEHQAQAILDPGAAVTLISQRLVVKLELKPEPESDLPTLAWVAGERRQTYGAYALHVRMTDDHGAERTIDAIAYGVDMEGPEILLGNYTLHKAGVQLDLGTQTWKFGATTVDHIELVSPEVIDEYEGHVGFLGLVMWSDETRTYRVLNAIVSGEPCLPDALAEYADVFAADQAAVLPQHKKTDHAIPIVDGKEAPYGPLYNLSERELSVLREYLETNLANGRIQHSNSPAGAPILFVPKKDGGLRLCVDYRGLNSVTVKDRCPLPLINETLDRLSGARYYTALDLKDAYYRLRIKAGDEWKTAFRTRYGHFEYLVMPFGLANAPATFQAYINRTLAGLVDHVCVVYLDDILIYTHSEDVEDHWRAVCAVLARLRQHSLYANLAKCQFATQEVEFLGFRVGTTGVSADLSRVETIKNWPVPISVKELQSFLGFANFYRRFIGGYAKVTVPLTDLLKEGQSFEWTDAAQSAFDSLKTRYTTAPILRHFDPALKIRIETDASQFAIAAILSQLFEDGKWHPVAFVSKKLEPAERNWEVYDQELFAIVYAFKQWRHYAEGAQHTIEVHTDHDNLRGIRAVQKLNPRQARWAVFLSGFDFEVFHRQGKKNPADGPSRRPDYYTENTEVIRWLPTLRNKLAAVNLVSVESGASGSTTEEISEVAGETPGDRTRSVVNLIPAAGTVEYTQLVPRKEARVLLSETVSGNARPWTKLLREAQQRCPVAQKHIAALSHNERTSRHRKESLWRLDENGLLRHKGRIYVPPEESIRQELLLSHHDHYMAGHFDARRTHELLARSYYWQAMQSYVDKYVKSCATCQRSKAPRHLPYGELASLPIPDAPFEELTMDFITGLPPVKQGESVFDAILVIVDRYSKMVRYLAARKDWSAKDLSENFFKTVCCSYWGTPKGIVSDRGPTFTSAFWGEMCYQLQMKRRLSSAFHPQTDGQTERQNQTLEHFLRCYCSENPEQWVDMLPLAEFAYNNSVHSSTGVSPFFLVQGQHPRLPEAVEDDRLGGEVPAATSRVEQIQSARQSLEQHLAQAQEYQKRYYDKKHTVAAFKKGDMILLSTKNLQLKQPSKKTNPKYIGPFKIRDAVGTQAYRLWLPTAYRIHDVFHVSLLKPFHQRQGMPEEDAKAPEIQSDGEESWNVEAILDHRIRKGQKEYLLKWEGYGDGYNKWVMSADCDNMDEMRAEYESRARSVNQKRRK